MTAEEFKDLKAGDIVRHKHMVDGLIVHTNNGKRATAIGLYELTNPLEWDIILKANYYPDGAV